MKILSTKTHLSQMREAMIVLLSKTTTRQIPANEGFIAAALLLLNSNPLSLELRVTDIQAAVRPVDQDDYTAVFRILTNENIGGAELYMQFNAEDFEEYAESLKDVFKGLWVVWSVRGDKDKEPLSAALAGRECDETDIAVYCDLEGDEYQQYLTIGTGFDADYFIVEGDA